MRQLYDNYCNNEQFCDKKVSRYCLFWYKTQHILKTSKKCLFVIETSQKYKYMYHITTIYKHIDKILNLIPVQDMKKLQFSLSFLVDLLHNHGE